MTSEQKEMEVLADRLWNNFFREKTREFLSQLGVNVGSFRAKVTSAYSNGVLGVQRPFDEELFIPCVASMQGAEVGSEVLVLTFGSGNNAANSIVFAYMDFSNL